MRRISETKWPQQRAFQFVGEDMPAERNAQPAGYVGGSPYWDCGECGQPVFNFEDAPYYTLEEFSEEVETGGVVDDATIQQLQDTFTKTVDELPAIINESFEGYSGSFDNLGREIRSAVNDLIENNFGWFNDIYKRFSNTKQGEYIRSQFGAITNLPFSDAVRNVLNQQSGLELASPWSRMEDYPALVESSKQWCLRLILNVKEASQNIMKTMMELRGYRLGKQFTAEIKHPVCQKCYDEQVYKCEEKGCDFETLDKDEVVEVMTKVVNEDPDETAGWAKPVGTQTNLKGIKEPSTLKGWGDSHPGYRYESTILCKDHGATCDFCGEGLNKSSAEAKEYDGEWYHDNCFWDRFTTCEGCGEIIYTDDSQWDENTEATLCQSCYEDLDTGNAGTVDQNRAAPIIESIMVERPNLYPLDENTISGNILPVLELAGKKFGYTEMKDEEKIKNWVMKRIQKPEAKAAVDAEFDVNETVAGLVKTFEKNIDYHQRMKKNYPKLKGFRPIPLDVKVEDSTSHDGTVFALYPTDETLDWADRVKPGAKDAYNKYMRHKGHHSGSFGYARMSEADGNIIIDNLQTDLDAPAFANEEEAYERRYGDYKIRYERAVTEEERSMREEPEENIKPDQIQWIKNIKAQMDFHKERLDTYQKLKPALNWWFGLIKKFWAPYLLDIIRDFADEYKARVFLTSFDMQSEKWNGIPKRNRDIYDRLPEMMGMNDTNVAANPEDLPSGRYDMKRVAEELFQLTRLFCKRAEDHSTE